MDEQASATDGGTGVQAGGIEADARLTYGLLFILGGIVACVSLVLPGDPERQPGALGACAAVVFSLGVLVLRRGTGVPSWFLGAAVTLTIGAIGLAAAFSGPSAAGLSLVAFTLVVLPGFYYFQLRTALGFAAYASGVYGAVLLLEHEIPLRGLQLLVGLAGMAAAALIMSRLRGETNDLLARLDHAARTDPLTGLANRREFGERFTLELARAERTGTGLALLVIDLDGFKQVNDAHGHEAGDRALSEFGTLLRVSTRQVDLVARLGGEEFAVLAPDTGADAAVALAERIRRTAATSLRAGAGAITISCGVATHPRSGADADGLLRSADEALYAAKRAGRNRTILHGEQLAV